MQHLKQLLIEKNVSQTQLAQVLDRNKSAITNLLQGKRQLKAEEVVKIAAFLQVPEAWVLGVQASAQLPTASGADASQPMPSQAAAPTEPAKTAMIFSQPVSAMAAPPVATEISTATTSEGSAVSVSPTLAASSNASVETEVVRIPFHGSVTNRVRKSQCVVRMGEGYGFEDVFFATDDSYALEVQDSDMDMLGFMPGDVVLSELGVRVKPGDIAVVQYYVNERIAVTLRKYEPPFLVPYSSQEGVERLHEGRTSVQIVSPVLRLIRLMN